MTNQYGLFSNLYEKETLQHHRRGQWTILNRPSSKRQALINKTKKTKEKKNLWFKTKHGNRDVRKI